MQETSFIIANTGQKIKINPNDVFSHSDKLNSYLNFQLSFELNPPTKLDFAFDCFSIAANLHFQNPTQILSEVLIPTAISVAENIVYPAISVSFILNEKSIHFIESNRKGDIFLGLELKIQAAIKRQIPNSPGVKYYAIDHLVNESVKINFSLPHSNWVEKILPGLGYRNLRLIEIPLYHDNLKEAYKDIIFEFNRAEQYFNSKDNNKCVAHCRATLDMLNKNLKSFNKKDKKYEKGFEWLETISNETLTWLRNLEMATYHLSSETHHTGEKLDFGRQEAESIYLITIGLLNYIGNLK
jgi:hypothetical protein